jgi:hypothetical protein
MCFIPIAKLFLTKWFDYSWYRLLELEIGLKVGVTGRQYLLTSPRQLIPPLVYSEVRVCPILWFVFPTGLMTSMSVGYLCHLMHAFHAILNIWTIFIVLCHLILEIKIQGIKHKGENGQPLLTPTFSYIAYGMKKRRHKSWNLFLIVSSLFAWNKHELQLIE